MKLKILIVDDYVEFAGSLKDLLETKGYHTDVAYGGQEAVERVKKEKFDIVLMDIRMPGMSGEEALVEIKKIDPALVVILMTGFAVEEVIKSALEEGALAVLNKPLNIPELLQYVESGRSNE